MKESVLVTGLFVFLMALWCRVPADACTGLQIKAEDESVVNARTLEFAVPLNSNVIVVPRGYPMVGALPSGKEGLKWTSKYAFVGANAGGQPIVLDGLNEKGLYFWLYYFPSLSDFPKLTHENAHRSTASWRFMKIRWVSSQTRQPTTGA